jgi:hypothetical protein
MKKIILLLVTSFVSVYALAQNFPYGQLDSEALEMKKYDKDTSAHAVVLREYGTSRITIGSDDNIKLIFEYHVKIKIFDSKGFDNGTIAIKVHNSESNNSTEEVDNIAGITYYKDENGAIQQNTLDPKKVYTTRDYKYQSTMKFTMPGLRNGCVIEYKYRLESPFFLDHFRPWEFQSDIPKIYSEYEAHIPGHFTYNAAIRGNLKLTKTKSEVERGCFSTHGASSDCSDISYGMGDIPAFVEEDYMTSPKNFLSAINFELVEYIDPYRGVKVKATKEWKDIDYLLKTDQSFGTQLKRKELLKDRMAPVLVGKSDELEKAKAIYAYLQKWFKWNEYIGIQSEGLKKALDSHSGSIADINISLIAALNSAGINTEAVLLSTRDHGLVNDLYPALNDFNYVIAKANIGDKSYLLDATDPLLAFGMLPKKCLNDKGRVFSLDKPSYWMDMSDSKQREHSTYTFDLTLQDNGRLKGTIIHYSSGYSGYLKRKEIKKFNTIDEYVENMDEKLPKLKILKSSITNLDSLDMALGETYEVELDVFDNLNHDRLRFNPFILNWITANPFKLAERDYPVDWGMPSDERYILTLHLPSQYSIENPPQNVAFGMPNNGGKFLTDFESDNNTFTFSHITQFNRSIYGADEYPYLKELYNKIILSEKNELVFKKK